MSQARVLGIVGLAALAVAAVAYAQTTVTPVAPTAQVQTAPLDAKPEKTVWGDAKAGASKAGTCAACHGLDGNPTDPQYPRLAGQSERYIAQQIALFDGLEPGLQQQSLEDVLRDAEQMEENINRLHDLWRRGDAEGIEAETNQRMRDEYPGLYDRINRDRNLAWLPVLQERLDRGGNDDDVLVVVGALHLLGDDGLVHLLREAGYTVERL
mgnify:CR=1 FL=1